MCGTCSEKKVLLCDCENSKKRTCSKNVVNVYVLPDNSNSLNDSNSSCRDNISCYLNSNKDFNTKAVYIRRYHLDVLDNKCVRIPKPKPKYKSKSKSKSKPKPKVISKPKKTGCGCSK